VIAVVSGFQPEIVPVVTASKLAPRRKASDKAKEQQWRIHRKADGSFFEYVNTENFAVLNTGIVTAYSLAPAIDLIRKHAEGPEEKSLQRFLCLRQVPAKFGHILGTDPGALSIVLKIR
jgi:hypothetical protein